MCLILDTNSLFLDPNNEDMKPVRKWVDDKSGKIAYSPGQDEDRIREVSKCEKPV